MMHGLNIVILIMRHLSSDEQNVTIYTDIIKRLENPISLVHGEKGYIYSAVMKNKTLIVLTGWHKLRLNALSYCCAILSDGQRLRKVAKLREDYRAVLGYKKGPDHLYDPVQFECELPVTGKNISGIGISFHAEKCSDKDNYYIKVHKSSGDTSNKFGMCVKHLYGSVDARKLVEWLEAQRYLGVDHILVQLVRSDVADDVLNVLGYYTQTGWVETVILELPGNGTFPRSFRNNFYSKCAVDTKVARLNCQERLAGFKYAMILDIDEFIVPENASGFRGSLRKLLDDELKNDVDSGIQFMTRMHVLSWKPARETHSLFIGRFINSTDAWWDRWKHVYVPERIKPGSYEDHSYLAEDGYNNVKSLGSEIASIRHYRECRREWEMPSDVAVRMNASHSRWHPRTIFAGHLPSVYVQNGTLCEDFTQREDSTMEKFIIEIETNILRVVNKLGLM